MTHNPHNLTTVRLFHSMVSFSPNYRDIIILNLYKTTQDILDQCRSFWFISTALCAWRTLPSFWQSWPDIMNVSSVFPEQNTQCHLHPLELYPHSIPCVVFCIALNTTWVYLFFFLVLNCFYYHSRSLKLMVKWTGLLSNVNSQHLKLHLANSQCSINIYLVLL